MRCSSRTRSTRPRASRLRRPPAVAANVAYFGADDGRLYAVDVTTGSELWRFDLGVPVRSAPAIAGNMLFVTAEDGSLYAFVSTVLATAGTQPVAAAPLRTRLLGNHPDPFNPATTIVFDVGGAGDGAGAATQAVLLRIYDPAGRAVRTLVDRRLAPGHHAVSWDGLNADGEPVVSVSISVGSRWGSRHSAIGWWLYASLSGAGLAPP